jgi:prepilin-type N-terminal cleavage/methylation domain-containing protein
MHKDKRSFSGFTLIEILVVVALIAILAAITIIAINPAKNFADTRNAQRSSDVTTILNAVTQYTSEEGNALGDLGTIPLCTATPAQIGSGSGNVNLSTTLVDEYIVAVPKDPSGGTDAATGYTICQTSGGRVQVNAPSAENDKTISVTR